MSVKITVCKYQLAVMSDMEKERALEIMCARGAILTQKDIKELSDTTPRQPRTTKETP